MSAVLRRVMVCSPTVAGWNDAERANRWRELAYGHRPDFNRAEGQHRQLTSALEEAGADAIFLTDGDGLSLDAVYAHDASLVTDDGAVLMRMGKATRESEPASHGRFYESQGIPVLGAVESPGTVEAGDLVWLDGATLLVGRGYRTNDKGIEQLRALLSPKGIEVLAAPLPHGPGPAGCLHLMSLISILEGKEALVDLPWLSVPAVELLRRRGFRLIQIDPSERDTMACNVLALGDRRLLALEENAATNRRLKQQGFDVRTFAGSEISQNGSGGPTCLTRPLLRG